MPQDAGSDGPITTIRLMLQTLERKGDVDYSVGGHTCSRPPSVQQGTSTTDFFELKPDEMLLWRPQAVQAKNLKGTNIASHFAYSMLDKSPLQLVPW